jgi:tetratricopeptide (TPR) repeat protein
MRWKLGALAALCIVLLLPAAALGATSKLTVNAVDESGRPVQGAVFLFDLADDPEQELTIGENDAGQYAESVKVAKDGGGWNLTKVIAAGYLPVQISIVATAAGGDVVQQVDAMPLDPGTPIPAIEMPAGGETRIDIVLGDSAAVMARFREARAAARKAQEEEAARKAESAIKGAHAEALRLYNAGEKEASLPQFEQAVAEHPEDGELRLTYVRVLYETGHFEEFEQAAAEILADDPGNTELLMMLYTGRRERKNLTGALEAILELKKQGARGSDLMPHLDYLAKSMGRTSKAIPAYEAILSIDSENREACIALATIHGARGDWNRADQYLDRAVELAPRQAAGLYYEMGAGLLARDRTPPELVDRAIELLRKTIEIDPGFAAAYKILGLGLWKKEDIAGTRQAFEKYLELNPNGEDREQIDDYLSRLAE